LEKGNICFCKSLRYFPINLVYVTNVDSNNVSVISGFSNSVIATVTVGTTPFGIGVNP